MRGATLLARGEHAPGLASIAALSLAPLGAVAGQAVKPRLDLGFVERDLRGLRPLGRFLPFGQAREQPLLGLFRLAHMRREHAGPRPAQPGERLQGRPRALALGPIVARAVGQQLGGGALEQGRDSIVACRFVKSERVSEALGRRDHEPRRMHEREQLEQIEARQVGIAEPAGNQRRVEQQQGRIRRRHDRIALGRPPRDARAGPDPAAGVAGVKRGQGKRIHRRDDAARRTKSKRIGARLDLFLTRAISESRDFEAVRLAANPALSAVACL